MSKGDNLAVGWLLFAVFGGFVLVWLLMVVHAAYKIIKRHLGS